MNILLSVVSAGMIALALVGIPEYVKAAKLVSQERAQCHVPSCDLLWLQGIRPEWRCVRG
jgi:hypothetical protein